MNFITQPTINSHNMAFKPDSYYSIRPLAQRYPLKSNRQKAHRFLGEQ
jgi:hypothetical protein